MDSPSSGFGSNATTAVVLAEDGAKEKQKTNNKAGQSAALFPKKLKGHGGCKYERLDDAEGGEIVYVPFGITYARSELGWRAKHDAKRNKLFFIRLSNAAEKTWRLPAIPAGVLQQYGVLHGGGEKEERQILASHTTTAGEAAGSDSDEAWTDAYDDDDDDEGDAAAATPFSGNGSYGDRGAFQQEHEQGLYQDGHTTLFCVKDGSEVGVNSTNDVALGYRTHMENEEPLVPGDKAPTFKEPQSLLNHMSSEDAPVTPPSRRPVASCAVPAGEVSLAEAGVARLIEEQRVARHYFEEEEKDERGALLDTVQGMLDNVLFPDRSVEREESGNLAGAGKHSAVPVLDDLAEDNELFLRNTRLSHIEDDEAVTPLEKLLRDSSPEAPHQRMDNNSAAETYANIYQPLSAKPDDTALPLQSISERTANTLQTPFKETNDESSSPRRLLEVQRHQVEMVRRLTQRGRDNLERALEARQQPITVPSDAFAQLRYEPSSSFTRDRQAIMGALSTYNYGSSGGEVNAPRQEYQPQQVQLPPPLPPPQKGPQGMRAHSADVSPISPRTFIHSPSPPKPREPAQDRREAIVAEAYEAKYEEGLAVMQKLMELYQTFMITKPEPLSHKELPYAPSNKRGVVDVAESSAAKYEERLACIKGLYTSSATTTNAADCHHQHQQLQPPHMSCQFTSLDPPNEVSCPLPNAFDTLLREHKARFHNSVPRPGDARQGQGSSAVECTSPVSLKETIIAKRRGVKTPNPTTSVEEAKCGKCGNKIVSFRSPHRHIMTPPSAFPVECASPREHSSVLRPVLRWDERRSGNILISQKGTTCIADASRALELISSEARRAGNMPSNVSIPMYAIGTIGISEGELIFEVRVDAHPPSTNTRSGVFAVGVATKFYRGGHKRSPAYLFRSDGTIVASADDRKGVPYGSPYHFGSHITVHLNLVQHELSFFLNGRALGVAFKFRGVGDPEPLFPLVVLSGEGETASFVPPSAPQLPPHLRPPLQQTSGVLYGL
ncbi:hypothetical protein DQ04_01601070 [Trypanosoma grayi]|uniref:hypothetical protein n=1 Tax=Trypanosoma grayi TaxID=71804 RepID=UPI0004F47A3A|nr:hypothetical protein DQ04_01601070 [Trypanosoma grayi]KEG12582.1 hypothetical protein DQ04_01601070 [Trypanosoma grayi]